jgi:hypothetical protein
MDQGYLPNMRVKALREGEQAREKLLRQWTGSKVWT